MRAEIRGIIEQTIDYAISDEQMSIYQQFFKTLKPYVQSQEDAVFGFVVGSVITSIINFFFTVFRKKLTPNEIEETRRIIYRRIHEIRSRVLVTLT